MIIISYKVKDPVTPIKYGFVVITVWNILRLYDLENLSGSSPDADAVVALGGQLLFSLILNLLLVFSF